MSEGYSFETFAAEVDTCKETIYAWTRKHPEFLDAKKRAEAKCQKWWEAQGRAGLFCGKDEKFNATVWIFNMKNRFYWRDAKEDAAPPPPKNDEKIKSMFALIDQMLDDLAVCRGNTSEPELPSSSP